MTRMPKLLFIAGIVLGAVLVAGCTSGGDRTTLYERHGRDPAPAEREHERQHHCSTSQHHAHPRARREPVDGLLVEPHHHIGAPSRRRRVRPRRHRCRRRRRRRHPPLGDRHRRHGPPGDHGRVRPPLGELHRPTRPPTRSRSRSPPDPASPTAARTSPGPVPPGPAPLSSLSQCRCR